MNPQLVSNIQVLHADLFQNFKYRLLIGIKHNTAVLPDFKCPQQDRLFILVIDCCTTTPPTCQQQGTLTNEVHQLVKAHPRSCIVAWSLNLGIVPYSLRVGRSLCHAKFSSWFVLYKSLYYCLSPEQLPPCKDRCAWIFVVKHRFIVSDPIWCKQSLADFNRTATIVPLQLIHLNPQRQPDVHKPDITHQPVHLFNKHALLADEDAPSYQPAPTPEPKLTPPGKTSPLAVAITPLSKASWASRCRVPVWPVSFLQPAASLKQLSTDCSRHRSFRSKSKWHRPFENQNLFRCSPKRLPNHAYTICETSTVWCAVLIYVQCRCAVQSL